MAARAPRRRAIAGSGVVALCCVAFALPAAAEQIRDWPCKAPYAEDFAAEDVWGGPLPASLEDGWQDDAAVRDVVEYAANPENTPGLGRKRIQTFAGQVDGDRDPRLMLVFAGLLHEFDVLREIVVGGIRDFVVRAKIIDEAMDKNQAALARLPSDGGDAVEKQKRGYQEARRFDARQMDDAMDEAEFLCHRYDYLDKKLRELTAAIKDGL